MKNLIKSKKEYLELKPVVTKLVDQFADYSEEEYFKELVEKESIYLNSNNISKVEELLEELETFKYQMHWKEPNFIKSMFSYIVEKEENFNDISRAKILISKGAKVLAQDNMENLADITKELFSLLSRDDKEKVTNTIGFY